MTCKDCSGFSKGAYVAAGAVFLPIALGMWARDASRQRGCPKCNPVAKNVPTKFVAELPPAANSKFRVSAKRGRFGTRPHATMDPVSREERDKAGVQVFAGFALALIALIIITIAGS